MPPSWVNSPAMFWNRAKSPSNQNAGLVNRPELDFVAATNSHQMGMMK